MAADRSPSAEPRHSPVTDDELANYCDAFQFEFSDPTSWNGVVRRLALEVRKARQSPPSLPVERPEPDGLSELPPVIRDLVDRTGSCELAIYREGSDWSVQLRHAHNLDWRPFQPSPAPPASRGGEPSDVISEDITWIDMTIRGWEQAMSRTPLNASETEHLARWKRLRAALRSRGSEGTEDTARLGWMQAHLSDPAFKVICTGTHEEPSCTVQWVDDRKRLQQHTAPTLRAAIDAGRAALARVGGGAHE